MSKDTFTWWKHGVYQVYPRSFQDSDGDGVGDLRGLRARLDYLVDLGVNTIWLSPVFRSPMADFGYDVSCHTAIDPLFGDMAAFDALMADVHRRGMKLILDFIPNHTSDQHPWFGESRGSRRNARRDWYVWADPAPGGGPPNNWRGEFGGPAWTLDEASGQFYYHAFLPSQPDLNWRNPAVAEAMEAVMRFWLDRGVDGFRVDAIHHLFESEDLADNPLNPDWTPDRPPAEALLRVGTVDRPEVQEAVRRMRRLTDSYGDGRVLVGEAYLPLERLMAYYGGALDGFHLPFNFHLMTAPWTPQSVAALVEEYERRLPAGAWPNWVLSNHDRSRLASRLGPAQARVAAMLLLTLRGTPTIYQGDELGMQDVPVPPERVRDPWELNLPGMGLGRDPVRAPLAWSAAPHAGFSTAEPWLPLAADWRDANAARQATDPGSMLAFYRALLALRRGEAALWRGEYGLHAAHGSLLVFERWSDADRLLIVLEMAGSAQTVTLPPCEVLLSTHGGRDERVEGELAVRPSEGLVMRIKDRFHESRGGPLLAGFGR